ncbi:MAG: hypothetical protein R3C58_08620 [Parvularculaceae bacterium]
MNAAIAGAVYFLIAFAAGFAFGTVRVLALEPVSGPTLAVIIETPFMLAVSWFACRYCLRRYQVPASAGARLIMGGVAFAMLIGAEYLLSRYGFGRSSEAFLDAYRAPAGLIGLAGQVLFALFPLMQLRK